MQRIAATLLILLAATAASAQMEHHHAAMDHDRMFADAMINHHQDGIRMAQMAVDKAGNAELRSMARNMIEDQRGEIDQMQRLRGEGPMMPAGEMMQMPGMMSEAEMQRDMARLESASGHEFDVAFTEIMPKHHQGAITMSKHELEMGSNAGLKEIAQNIVDKQSRERTKLLAMHEDMIAERTAMTSSSSERQTMTKD